MINNFKSINGNKTNNDFINGSSIMNSTTASSLANDIKETSSTE